MRGRDGRLLGTASGIGVLALPAAIGTLFYAVAARGLSRQITAH